MAASIRDISNRIVATKKTAQITKAMNMVSASKLKSAERKTKNYNPFMDKIYQIVSNVLNGSGKDISHVLLSQRPLKTKGVILLTCDRGLAGSFNSGVCKRLKNDINNSTLKTKVLAIGAKGFGFCHSNEIDLINKEVIEVHDEIIFADIMAPVRDMLKLYETGVIDEIVVYYNQYVNTITQQISTFKLLPIVHDDQVGKHQNVQYDFEQDPQDLINILLPTYIENTIYGLVLNSKTGEHASRMTAMKNATDNADGVIKKLQVTYNRARQAAITLELTDIIGGANAVK